MSHVTFLWQSPRNKCCPQPDTRDQQLPILFQDRIWFAYCFEQAISLTAFPRKSLTLMLKMLSAFTGVIYPPLTTQSQSKTHWEEKSSHLCLPHTSWFFLDLLHPPQGAPTPPSESLSPMSSAALPRHWPLTHPRAPLPGARGYFKTLSLKQYSD